METLFGFAVALGLAIVLCLPASGQALRCTRDTLSVGGTSVLARFCVPAVGAASTVDVTETFTSAGKSMSKTVSLAVVAGALTSRTIDDVDLAPIGPKSTLHMTLAYQDGEVRLEHALALPGAVPVK